MNIKKETIKVYDMTCSSCEARVEKALNKLNGVLNAKASHIKENAYIEYDADLCNIAEIKASIKAADYSTQQEISYKIIGILIIAIAIIFLGSSTQGFDIESKLTNATYLALFFIGILTSLHCVGMCSGIMLSQSLSKEKATGKFQNIKPAILYNGGRVISYTLLGGLVGALGSVLSFSLITKAALEIFAGVFMIIMGSNMAGFSLFKRFNFKLPISMCSIKQKFKSPFIVGLLNGFMPCGPLQTMQLYALSTGNPLKGALSMFIFSLGTVPLMLTFGALSSLLSKGSAKKILKLSGILVIILGLIMSNRGLALTGMNPVTSLMTSSKSLLTDKTSGTSNSNISKATIKDGLQIIKMTADGNGYTPNSFYVKKGMPVKWIIDGKELNSCNSSIVVPSLNIQKKLQRGENIIEFTPTDKDINFSCWMGMITGVIKVVDNVDSVDTSKTDASIPPKSSDMSSCSGTSTTSDSSQTATSIYGADITKVPTERLIKKAIIAGAYQSITLKGVGYEMEPMIVVTKNSIKSTLTFDFTSFDNSEDKYLIVDAVSGNTITSFTGKKGINDVEFTAPKAGLYGVIKGQKVIELIDVVEDFNNVDLEKVRKDYLK